MPLQCVQTHGHVTETLEFSRKYKCESGYFQELLSSLGNSNMLHHLMLDQFCLTYMYILGKEDAIQLITMF